MFLHKSLFTISIITLSAYAIYAEEIDSDSVPTYNLEEIQVEAPRVIRKVNKLIDADASVDKSTAKTG